MAASGNDVIERLNHFGDMFWNFNSLMTLQVSVLVLVLLLLDLLLRHRVRAVTRYWLWSLVLLKLMLPVSLYSPLSAASWLSDWLPATSSVETASTGSTAKTVTVSSPSALPTDSVSAGRHFISETMPEPRPLPVSNPASSPVDGPVPALSNLEVQQSATVPPLQLQPTAILLLSWLAVVTILSAFVVRRTLRVRRLTQQAELAPAELTAQMNDCARLLGLKQTGVQLKVSAEAGSPAICGLWKPTIILPQHLLDKLNPEQFRQVFIHELAHWKRFDLQLNCLQTLLLILYFYNPLVWLAHVMLRRLREQAVDETVLVTLNGQSAQYSATLLDIASLTPIPDRASRQLLGILEPRKPLAQRIRRIISRPIPRSARLGLASFSLILLTGALLLPMSRLDRRLAAADEGAKPETSAVSENAKAEPETVTPGKKTPSKPAPPDKQKSPEKTSSASKYILSGRLTDPTGAPVTDAQITLLHKNGGRLRQTRTDQDGNYHFSEIYKPGEHRMMIKSERWVGIERSSECPRVDLSVNAHQVKNITLERACQLRIETVDEQGKPVSGVRVYSKSLSDTSGFSSDTVTTDRSGQVILGLKPSRDKYLIGTSSPDYAFGKLVIQLDDPGKIVTHQIVQRAGEGVIGNVLCSDGKPPVGWKINALPDWWNFGRSPSGYPITDKGDFILPHIAEGVYNVTVGVPAGGTTFRNETVLGKANLINQEQPLSLKLDYPSPASLVSLSGKLNFHGAGQPERGFWIYANSGDLTRDGSVYIRPGQTEFRIDPIQKGKYTLRIQSPGMEFKEDYKVVAPSKDLNLDVVVKGKPKLLGEVVQGDSALPVEKFRVRAIKLRTLRGPNFVQSSRWQEVSNQGGNFTIEVNSPGVYRVEVAANGFAKMLSQEINTEENQGKPIQVKLTKGVTLIGTVKNEQGQPINGATVIPLSLSRGVMPGTLHKFVTENGAVKTVDGKFTIPHLAPGKEWLKVTHPDYDFAIVKDIDLAATPIPKVKVTLAQGGTVQGLVTDENGKPQPNVPLFFQDQSGYNGTAAREAGLLATVITDEEGRYSVSHLPNQICYVNRKEEWSSLGVVRQAVLPQNGKTSTLNLGGPPKLRGRLKVNGSPLANTRILLAGENPNFGVFRAYANTDSDGDFQFFGAGPGQRTLYYEVPNVRHRWVPVKSLDLYSYDQNLGTLEAQVGQLTVNCQPEAPDDMRLSLNEYDPVWTSGMPAGNLAPRTNNSAPFVFTQVTPRDYELMATRSGYPTIFQKVDVTSDNMNGKLTLSIPQGTSSVQFKLDQELMKPENMMWLKLWSEDKRLLTRISPDKQGGFVAGHLPAGDYFLTQQDLRDSKKLLQFTLKQDEQKTLNLTFAQLNKPAPKPGFRMISVFTEEGVPLPGCHIQLQSSTGKISRHSQQNERQHFVGDPITYDLTASYPGFQTLHRKVKLITSDDSGKYPDDLTINLLLKPKKQ
ncbi:Methicillin resistance mecR1 protein [Gimesia panareensis]|uniref:Methicillin resistance mecR1 protein n=1 Tax=Gimesia panareensis TaxID=2527978 RepID=A0A518FS51_9PLAN|nr:carboxypeptidase regulatory-like domain-containing protein [Gimesia panareensis]QDV19153.1 Methicillin resistance mecR1 protein [Gimesia panareensis]